MLRAATRGSALARLQTDLVAQQLGLAVEPVVVETTGDRNVDVPIWSMGGQGVFAKEVQRAVLEGAADFAVHSAKDLPSTSPDGLVIAAVPQRGDPRDALVGSSLSDLPVGARVGTGSVRRRAQLAWLRPDLTFGELRGNIGTRLAKAADFHAVVIALAALARLGRSEMVSEELEADDMLPQVGQGALAVECRANDEATRELLASIDHGPSRRAVTAERAWLAEIGGGCDKPVAAHAVVRSGSVLHLSAMLATADGHVLLRADDIGDEPEALGRGLARYLLDDAGGRALLEDGAEQ